MLNSILRRQMQYCCSEGSHIRGGRDTHNNAYDFNYDLYYDISDCPYCGRERMLLCYQNFDPVGLEYRVVHKDENEAILDDCIHSLKYFGSPEEAVKAANRRDGIAEESEDQEPEKSATLNDMSIIIVPTGQIRDMLDDMAMADPEMAEAWRKRWQQMFG